MQHIALMLVLGTTALPGPIGQKSPWLDARTSTEENIFQRLESQSHRRVIKTHTPLDGVQLRSGIRVIAMARHPLDVALSFRDHFDNTNQASIVQTIDQATGIPDMAPREEPPKEIDAYLKWWMLNDVEPDGAGPYGLGDYCNSMRACWAERDSDNVLLIHYDGLKSDLTGQIARVARHLSIDVDASFVDEVARATSFEQLRTRSVESAPFGDQGFWVEPEQFFRVGGSRNWLDIVGQPGRELLHQRMDTLLSPAARSWALGETVDL